MKKIKLILPFLIFPSLFSCDNSKKINTLFGINNVNNRKLKSISKDDLGSLLDNEYTFIFIQTTNTCECSKTFEKVVNQYINETGLLIYSIEYTEAKYYETKFSLRDDSPTFHVVLNGINQTKLEKTLSNGTKNFFENYDDFKSFMNNHFSSPSLIYVDEDELDNLYKGNNKFVIYFSKSDCTECKVLTNKLFNEYGQVNLNMKKIYVLDYKGYSKEDLDKSRIKYGLNETVNKDWGYKTGALPMIYTITPDATHDPIKSIDQGFTFGNDILDSTYKVSESYYNELRISKIKYSSRITNQINKQYKKENIIDNSSYITLNQDTNLSTYKELFVDFMNYIDTKF